MSSVWISRDSWNKVWSALHNIRVRQSHTVKTASAMISGAGTSARLNIDLPAVAGFASGDYNGFFKCVIDKTAQENTFKIRCFDGSGIMADYAGYFSHGTDHFLVANGEIQFSSIFDSYFCIRISYDSQYKFEYSFVDDLTRSSGTGIVNVPLCYLYYNNRTPVVVQIQNGILKISGVL